MDRIKRISYEVLDLHKPKFGEDFVINKKALDEVSIVRSKGLKNEVAGYITKFIKKEVREGKAKQARIDASKAEQQIAEKSEVEITEDSVVEEETETIEVPETTEAASEEIPSETAEETTE